MNIFKTIRKTYFGTFLASLVLFTSFSQFGNSQNLNQQGILKKTKKHDKKIRLLTDSEITQIGKEHAANLELLMSKNPTKLNVVKTTTLELYKDNGLTSKSIDNYFEISDQFSTKYLTSLIKQAQSDFVDSDLLIQKLREIKTITDNNQLMKHQNLTRNKLKGVDLDTYLLVSTVYQFSGDFWSTQNPDMPVETQASWREADGISAAIGFFTLAAAFTAIYAVGVATGGTGVIPTVTIVASLLRIGASSALASIYAAFS
ncbi:hypothetical protein [Winogradskyella thalassocola]|uniref:Uncharacterized protein n=1 Tax=Winogradskyella thalassocola TaxID=262004 RepID=A0A1G7WJP6_9FLAO|nr:hypothetical protein [Winogradskyella thalassocola]SDG72221.1 hypothetical protein SAMN04489796_101394 [Winogradskyella thalassocola]